MAHYITIDGGTSNTRVSLTRDEDVISTLRISLGAFSVLDNKSALKEAIKSAIDSLLSISKKSYEDIECILASGMITSEFGLCPLDHINVPAGLGKLHQNMERVILDEICPVPFMFVRGVKCIGDSLEDTDMMRGEETELMGIMTDSERECIYILPGSHSKVIRVNPDREIETFSTLLTGEMVKAISDDTILKDAIDLKCKNIDYEYLLKGYKFCKEHGINKSLFKVRILKNVFSAGSSQLYSFFLGIILTDEIKEVEKYDAPLVVIGGKHQLKEATAAILREVSSKEIIVLSDEQVDQSVTKGLMKIYKG